MGYNKEDVVTPLALSFLIGSSSFLQVTRTTIKARVSSNLDEIRLLIAELAALKRLKGSHRLIMGEMLLVL